MSGVYGIREETASCILMSLILLPENQMYILVSVDISIYHPWLKHCNYLRKYYLAQVIKEICNDHRKPYSKLAKPIFTGEQLPHSEKETTVNPIY